MAWLKEVRQHSNEFVSIMLIGNKSDLKSERQVSKEDAQKFSKNNGIFFMELTAKENTNKCVNKAFNFLLREILKIQKEDLDNRSDNDLLTIKSKIITLHQKSTKNEQKEESCCS